MNSTEAAELLGHCSSFDNRKPSVAAAVAWASALHDMPLDADTKAAVAAYYTTAPKDPDAKLWILPHHVRTLRTKLRNARLENFAYTPPPGDRDPNYLNRLRGQAQAIASGRVAPPASQLLLTGGPHRDVAKQLEGVGHAVPETDEESLAATVRRAGPLGTQCPTCGAAIGRPCRTPGGSPKQPLGKPRARPHTARIRAASGQPSVDPNAAEETAARRAAARAALDRLTPGDRARLAEFQRKLHTAPAAATTDQPNTEETQAS